MKRCEICNDRLMTNKIHDNKEKVECVICGSIYEVVKDWRTINKTDGSTVTKITSVLRLMNDI